MCCFTASVVGVELTGIFARGDGRSQYLAYQMRYNALEELAMVLPLPTPIGVAEGAVRFIDLSGYPEFFADAEHGFYWAVHDPDEMRSLSSDDRLEVHEVGSYEASFIPRLTDFSRLDPRFRMPDGVWSSLPQYADWSFCVFKLREGRNDVHPMAFEFPRRDPARLFFPTVHVHDGTVREKAYFDHQLYCQVERPPLGWRTSARVPKGWREFERQDDRKDRPMPYGERLELYLAALKREAPFVAREFMATDKTQGLVDADAPLHQLVLKGSLANVDHYA